jgi:hypothetical protein
MYENRIIKPIKSILKGEGEEKTYKNSKRGADLDQLHYIHMWKYYSETSA